MHQLIKTLDFLFYPSVQNSWDDDLFRSRILAARHIQYQVLDIGGVAGIV